MKRTNYFFSSLIEFSYQYDFDQDGTPEEVKNEITQNLKK